MSIYGYASDLLKERNALRSVVRHLLGGDTPPTERHHWRDTDTPVTPAEAAVIQNALSAGDPENHHQETRP